MLHLLLFLAILIMGLMYWHEYAKQQQLHKMYEAAAAAELEWIQLTGRRLPMEADYALWTFRNYTLVNGRRMSVHTYLQKMERDIRFKMDMERVNNYNLEDLGIDEGPVETAMNHIQARKTVPLMYADDPALSTLTRQRS